MRLYWLTIFTLLLPASANAAVYFTEIAWMGSSESANHEWIELYNDGGPVNVDGWQITDNNNLSIELEGTIPAGSFVVLERSSDSSAAGSAFMIYTGSLVNSGTTLRLSRGNGSISDQVSGGTDWQNIGGNNETKETAQYTTGGWVTGVATPGSAWNGQTVDQSDDDEDGEDDRVVLPRNIASPNSGRNSSVDLTLPEVSLQLDIKAPQTGYVNQPINFTADAYGIGENLINSLSYDWNFGNGDTAKLEGPEYVFRHPGKYVVTLYANYKRQEQVAKHEITILPILLSLGTNRQGDITINNESKYEVDLSNYLLKGVDTFAMPPRTFLLPSQSIVIDKKHVGGSDESLVIIYDAEGVAIDMLAPANVHTLAASSKPAIVDLSPTPMISAVSTNRPVVATGENQQFAFATQKVAKDSPPVIVDRESVEPETEFDQIASVGQSQGGSPVERNWPYLALIGLILLGIFGAILSKKSNQSN